MAIDLLLINMHVGLDDRYGSRNMKKTVGGILSPFGICCIAGYLKHNGFSVKILDTAISGLNVEHLLGEIRALQPRAIGISSLTLSFHWAVKLAQALRSAFRDILLVIGGHHATIARDTLLSDYPVFDLLVYGEGERTMLELMSEFRRYNYDAKGFLKDSRCLASINGIVFKADNHPKATSPREPIDDLDSLPDPAWDILDMRKYIPLPNSYKRKPAINIITTRGCPYNCSFCSSSAVFGRRIRRMSPRRVISLFRHAQRLFGAREVCFWDDAMTFDKKWISEFCRIIIEEKIDITWSCITRVDTVSAEMLKAMKEAGCWNIFFGIESASQELLDIINKGITVRQIREAIRLAKEAGIEVRGSFMLALPGETPHLALKTIDFAIELDPEYAQFCITTPYPGTKLYDEAEKYGVLSKDFTRYSIWSPVFIPHGYKSREEIIKMEKRAMRNFYLRPKYILKRLRNIRTLEDIRRNLKGLEMLLGFLR